VPLGLLDRSFQDVNCFLITLILEGLIRSLQQPSTEYIEVDLFSMRLSLADGYSKRLTECASAQVGGSVFSTSR
jgi:hypothetical protein